MAPDHSLPILVVDDFDVMRRILCSLLKQIGYDAIDEATDGGAALACLSQRRYGLVISDWNMAPVSGLELVRRMRADRALQSVPLLLVTADDKPGRQEQALAAGASGYLVKPFDARTLRGAVAAAIAGTARLSGAA